MSSTSTTVGEGIWWWSTK